MLNEKEYEWTEGIPPMLTSRCNATAMGIDEYLTVLGGFCKDVVEIYDMAISG